MKYDEKYYKGIEFFNAGEYFDAHETWEDLWHQEIGEANGFIQGLIQFATALHHFEHKNLKGTRILFEGGMELLAPYPDEYWGMPLGKLKKEMTGLINGIMEYDLKDLPGRYHPEKDNFPIKFDATRAPKIKLHPAEEG